MTAQTAQRVGLVSEVVPLDELQDAADRLAGIIASQPPEAVQGTLRAVWAASDMGRLDALAMGPVDPHHRDQRRRHGRGPGDVLGGQANPSPACARGRAERGRGVAPLGPLDGDGGPLLG